jgi:hypothetical protein
MRAVLLVALSLLLAPFAAAQAAVSLNVQGSLNIQDSYGDPVSAAALAAALGVAPPANFSVTMTFDESPGWTAQSIDLTIGDRHWSRDSSDSEYGYIAAFGGVFMTAAFQEFDATLGRTQVVAWAMYFDGAQNSELGPSNDPADYLAASRFYANFHVAFPDEASVFLRLNPASLTGPNEPVSSVTIDGHFTPFPPPAPAPEPATWAMMIIGFGGVGATVRRRSIALAGV